ncbi:MAG: site-specific DNA-methyltransferase [Clostridiales bacterium]|nr:site-specific DNA-methyltransferase [Clostridiales bacterium]
MANLSKERRDRMIEKLEELKQIHNDDKSIAALNEIENALREKKYGLVWEEHSEAVDDMLKENIPVLVADEERRLCKDEDLPWNFIIEGDNLQALYLLEKTHRGKVDCIYIDPPYNTGATEWKYNNNIIAKDDEYSHSKWLSMMKSRLLLAKRLLNPKDSVLIVTIDEKEYLHLGCLLEEMFPKHRIQMISSVINVKGVAKDTEFSRTNEFIYIVQLGSSSVAKLPLPEEWLGNIKSTGKNKVRLAGLMRTGTGALKTDSPGCFYPIYFNENDEFIRVGEVCPVDMDRHLVPHAENEYPVWPIHKDGSEGRWMYRPEGLRQLISKGYVFWSKRKGETMGISYAPRGVQEKIESGLFKITGRTDDGSVIIDDSDYTANYIPGSQWAISSHNATEYGTKIIQGIIGNRFTFPKSLYAVHDVLRFFVSDKPNSIILDFFAGSGTTMHAVNLLNAEDGGQRTCIMVTNNEISSSEQKDYEERDIHKGDEEWEEHGIAKYVTWPRTVCSIKGVDVNGHPLKGDYGIQYDSYEKIDIAGYKNCYEKTKEEAYPLLAGKKMSDGFKANVKYFKCDWTPRMPEDYLLSNALCLHVKELIELQTAQEVDGVKNVLILSKSDFKKVFENPDTVKLVENVWVNENLIFNAAEMKLLKSKKFRYIPREFFSQELKEAGEYV